MHIQCKYLRTDIKTHHTPVARINILQPGFSSGKARENKQSLKQAKRRLTQQRGLQQPSARHGEIMEWWNVKKEGGGWKKRVINTEMLNITLIIKSAFSWGPHTSTIWCSSCATGRRPAAGVRSPTLLPSREPRVASLLAFSSCTSHLCRLAVPAEGNGN